MVKIKAGYYLELLTPGTMNYLEVLKENANGENVIYVIFFGTAKLDCAVKRTEIFSFFPLINNSVTIGLNFYY